MRKTPLLLFLILSLSAKSQDKGSLYVFDENWKPIDIKSAKFLLHTYQVNDTCWQWDYYHFVGPLVKTEQYRDKNGEEKNGVSNYYNENGLLDSVTNFYKGRKNGDSWRLSEDSFKFEMKYVYRDDSLIEVIDIAKKKKNSSDGDEEDGKESEYRGGPGAWLRYLQKKLEYPERAMNGNIQGQVIIFFIVDQSGDVIAPYICRSVEYSMDEESLKIINHSGKWTPSFQDGHYVRSYKVQPINFRLE